MNLPTQIPAFGPLDDNSEARAVLLQSGKLVHVPVGGLGLAQSSVEIIAGAGLTGGGDLTASRTLNVGAGTGITVNANDIAITNTITAGGPTGSTSVVPVITYNARGQLTAVTTATITPAAIGAQPVDATLTSLAAYNTNGVLVQTAADMFAGRTITGTANKIDVTNGNGVSGNPTLTIPDAVTLVTPTVTGLMTLSGGRIAFPSTKVPSADPNTLDDYEEGSSTPTVTGFTGGAITTYTASLVYTIVGNRFWYDIQVSITTNGAAATAVSITMPVAAGARNTPGYGRQVATGAALQAVITTGSTTLNVFTYNNAYPGGDGALLLIAGSYPV